MDDEELRLVLVILTVYRVFLLFVLIAGSPWWLFRMATQGRYRAGLAGRLGLVPATLHHAVNAGRGRDWVWVHAVSVGEVLAASEVIRELRTAGYGVAVSTTTAAGQALAKARFAESPVFYMPLDFGLLVGRYLHVLSPRLVVTMESELWPNLIHACRTREIPLAVVNARVSDRSFRRYMLLRAVWGPLLREVSLFLAQSEETAGRLREMGVAADRVAVTGNLKYDVKAPESGGMAGLIRALAGERPIVVAGSTVGGQGDKTPAEEEMVIEAWQGAARTKWNALLVLGPRHTNRFAEVEAMIRGFKIRKASELSDACFKSGSEDVEIVLLDTIGDLAGVYAIADIAFVGGSLVARGGHNPLEPVRFGVPVVMGESFYNFREVVGALQGVGGVQIVGRGELGGVLGEMLGDRVGARAMGVRGRRVFEGQAGATGRTVAALLGLVR